MVQQLNGVPRNPDELLGAYLAASDEDAAERLLADLISGCAEPIIRRVVRSAIDRFTARWPSWNANDAQEVDDIVHDVGLRLLQSLRLAKATPGQRPIGSFTGYAAVAARNACNSFLRAKYPARSRLKNKLRYTLTHQKGFAIWEASDGGWYCGVEAWKQNRAEPAPASWVNLAVLAPERIPLEFGAESLVEVTAEILRRAGSPLVFDDLVSIAAVVLRIRDHQPLEGAEAVRQESDQTAERVEQRLYLDRLWREILRLPVRQRAALLLGAGDDQSTSSAILLSEVRVASAREIADAVDLPANGLAEIWKDLPLDDGSIGDLLRASRNQVKGYRLSARRRLARRMRITDVLR